MAESLATDDIVNVAPYHALPSPFSRTPLPEPVADGTFLIDGKVDPDTGVLEGPVLYRQYGIWGGVCLKPGFDGREVSSPSRAALPGTNT